MHLKAVSRRLQESELNVHLEKSVFGAESIDFLGHRILADSLRPQQNKLVVV